MRSVEGISGLQAGEDVKKREKDCRQLLSILKRSGDYKALPGLDRPSPQGFAKYQDLAAHLLACEMQTLGAHGGWLAAAAACSFALRCRTRQGHQRRQQHRRRWTGGGKKRTWSQA